MTVPKIWVPGEVLTAEDLNANFADISDSRVVVQRVAETRTTVDDTNSTSFVDLGLAATITPLFADSTLVARLTGVADAYRSSGTPQLRVGAFRLRNETDDVALVGAEEIAFGLNLTATSSAFATAYHSGVLAEGIHTVDSLDPRTIRLQAKSYDSNVTVALEGAICTAILTVEEWR